MDKVFFLLAGVLLFILGYTAGLDFVYYNKPQPCDQPKTLAEQNDHLGTYCLPDPHGWRRVVVRCTSRDDVVYCSESTVGMCRSREKDFD